MAKKMAKEVKYPVELTKDEWDLIDSLMYQALRNIKSIYFMPKDWQVLALAHQELANRVFEIHECNS